MLTVASGITPEAALDILKLELGVLYYFGLPSSQGKKELELLVLAKWDAIWRRVERFLRKVDSEEEE